MKKIICIISTYFLVGCAGLTTVKTYDGPEQTQDKVATLSSLGLYPERSLSVQVMEIDGKSVDTTRTSEFTLLPGPHTLRVRVFKDLRWGVSIVNVSSTSATALISTSFKEAFINITPEFLAGHTYIPNAVVIDSTASASLDDAGTNFKQECMPLRRFAILYGGTSDGKKPGC